MFQGYENTLVSKKFLLARLSIFISLRRLTAEVLFIVYILLTKFIDGDIIIFAYELEKMGNYSLNCKSIIFSQQAILEATIWLLEWQIRQRQSKKKNSFLKNQLRHYKNRLGKINRIISIRYRSDS